jgi:hypothetical protein
MANKKYQFEFDFNTKDVKIVTDSVLTLKQEVRLLTAELLKTPEGTKEFEILKNKLNDTKDNMERVNAKSREFFGTLQLIPGPIGEIASKIDGTISLLKTFSGFSVKDIKSQFDALGADVNGIVTALGKATGITKIYTVVNTALSKSMTALGVAEGTAAVGARALASALVATGIGALVVGLGMAVSALMDFFDSEKQAKEESDRFTASLESQNRVLEANAKDLKRRQTLNLAEMKANGATEKQIRQQQLKDAMTDRELAYTEQREAAKKYNQALEVGDKEALKTARDNLSKKEQAFKDADNNIRVIAANNRAADNKDAQAAGEKALQNQTAAAAKLLAAKKDAVAQYKEALDTEIQNEVDKENTSAQLLAPLIKKRKEAEFKELKEAGEKIKQQLKDGIIDEEQAQVLREGITAKKIALDNKYKKLVEDALKEDQKRIEEKNKEDAEKIAKAEEFARKLADIGISAIKDQTVKEKEERKAKYETEKAALEKQFVEFQTDEKTRAEARKNLETALNNDLKAIDDKAELDKKETTKKAYDEQLRILELQGMSLLAGTEAYFENRKQILDLTMKKELEGLVEGSEEYLAVKAKYNKLNEQLDEEKISATGKVVSATLDSFASLGNALASSYDEEAKTSEDAFNKRKSLQKATAIMSAASGLVQILTQPSTLPSPFDWIVKGVNAAALAVATGINIKKIDETKFQAPEAGGSSGSTGGRIDVVATRASGGIITGPGTSTSDSIPARLSNGEYVVNARATQSFLPLLNSINDAGLQPRFAMGGLYKDSNNGYNVADNITEAISSSFNSRPIRTYVVGTDMSNQQQMDRTIKSRSLI